MRIAVTGSSGLIGTALVTQLHASGHEVFRLVRRPSRARDEITWDPTAGTLDPAHLAGVEAVVNLAGAPVGDHRWNAGYKRLILESRVQATQTLVKAFAGMPEPPRVLINGSAVGFYGDRGDEELTETSSGGPGFLADVVRAWEGAAGPAAEAGVRVVLARTGLVMSGQGGALARMLPLGKLGLGGPLGSGKQWWPWISLLDEVRALEFLLTTELAGPINLSAPTPERQAHLARTLGRLLHRPALLPTPALALRAALGEFAGEITGSQRMLPAALLAAGFTFTHPDVTAGLAWALRN